MSYSILFVCLGNICRSPMAEAVMRDLIRKEGLSSRLTIDSAGTGDWHVGCPPHEGTRKLLDRHDISYDGLRARKLQPDDSERFDLIVAMDRSNERNISAMLKSGHQSKVMRFMSLLPEKQYDDVPDPYYTGNFEEVYELVRVGCERLLAIVKQDERLA